ncbi:uncharacterized protein [Argopecten irradians]|uniref:uncharacterized protein n=1 Tax=Argopecten irradians TaxID=31199 RepID=UPI00371D2078
MSWNAAKLTCEGLGMHLAKLDTSLKQTYVQKYINDDWSADVTGELWIGLHKFNIATPELTRWYDCTIVGGPDSFDNGEPSTNTDDLCFTLSGGTSWRSSLCNDTLQAVCESSPGDCTFDTYPQNGCSHNLKASAELPWAECIADCLTDTLATGEQCWGVGHLDGFSGDDCWKFFAADDPDICIAGMYPSASIDVGIKICFESSVEIPVVPDVSSVNPDTPCFVIYTTPDTETTLGLTTTIAETTTTTEPTTAVQTTQTINVTSPTIDAATEPTALTFTTEQITTTTAVTTPTNVTSLPNLGVCRCTCTIFNTSLLNLQEEIEKLRVLLTVKKSSTSLYKRKFISVQDERISATSIGYVGATLLMLTFGTIVFLDFPALIQHVKRLCLGNTKHRVTSV